jgi:hypothetical protein
MTFRMSYGIIQIFMLNLYEIDENYIMTIQVLFYTFTGV